MGGWSQFRDVFDDHPRQDRANWILRDTRFTADDEGVAHDICPECGECQIDHRGGAAQPLLPRRQHGPECPRDED